MALVDELSRAEAWGPGHEGPVELIVTHASWVFRLRGEVFKVKRPVNLGFLDFSTLERRKAACEAELELNRRLAPGVYLDLVPLWRDAAGRHHAGPGGAPVEWAVHMVRLEDADRADARLAAGTLGPREIDLLAARLADFHHAARADAQTARHGLPDAVRVNVDENFTQTAPWVDRFLTPAQVHEVERFQRDFLGRRAELFHARAAAGRVRDGHGDLRLEHVYLRGEALAVIDCIEFNDRFRYADVASDLAFLAMDLAWQGRVDLAELLLARYARAANDYDLYAVADFYESYRAWVRGKVAGLLALDAEAPAATRARAEADARRYFLLALAESRRPLRPPKVFAVGGIIATGKSTVSDALGFALAAPVVDADRTRKSLLGVAPTQQVNAPQWAGAYGPQMTERTYAEVLRRAAAVLEAGRSVVLDASFRSAAWRAAAQQLAHAHGVPFLFIECRAPAEVCRERLRRRAVEGAVSDARLDLYDAFVAEYEPVTELPAAEHLVLDTSGPLEASLAQVSGRAER